MKNILLILSIAFCGNLFAQSFTVKGRVISTEDRNGMPGVTVLIQNTMTGAVTDNNGYYTVNVSSGNAVLHFSAVGFVSLEVPVNNRTEINVSLEPDVTTLEEVIVVGYGEQKKASIVGAISNARNEDLKKATPSNLTAAIGGRVTGALVRLGDGNVGGGDARYSAAELDNAAIYIRGRATTNTATPLVLIDGVESSFSRVNPEDVEQFSVLKDASATAVYGVRGANGVILITTKQGMLGKPKVTINMQKRMHKHLNYPHPLGAYDYAVLYNEANRNAGQNETYKEEDIEHWRLKDDPVGHPDVDWYEEMLKDHFFEDQYNMNIVGGTEFVKYYISGEYNHAGGPFDAPKKLENDYKRYNLRTNFDFKISSSTDLSVKLNGRLESRGDINYGESTGQRYYGSFWYGILSSAVNVAPIRNPNGTWAYGDGNLWNLRAILDESGYRMRLSNTLDVSTNLKQKLDFILPGLSVRGMYGSVFSSGSRRLEGPEQIPALWSYDPVSQKYTLRRPEAARSYSIEYSNLPYARRTQVELALNYEKSIAEKHNIGAMVVLMQSKSESNADLPVSHRGVAGRITYGYKSKYLSEVNMGYNGSDQFNKDNRYALFPSASVGWVISEENFMKDNVKFLDFLKIRASYGTAGNDKIGSYRYLYRYEFNSTSARWTDYQNEIYNFGVNPVSQSGMREGTLGNDKVTWEVAKKANLGLDFRMWGSRIRIVADIFREKRDNILATRGDVPSQSGIAGRLPAQNIGKVTNKGYEFELSYTDKFGDFDISIGGNYTYAHSNIDYIAETQLLYPWMMRVNHPVGQPSGYIWTGKFYNVDDLTNPAVPKPTGTVYAGDLMFEDLNGDGIIDNYDITYDKQIGYSTIPEIIYGFNTGFGFKGFYLDLFWQGAAHVSSRYNNELRYEFYAKNVLPYHKDRWVYDPDRGLDTRATAKYPLLIVGGSAQTRVNSSFQYLNSAFLRLKTAELGYNFPKQWVAKLRMSALRLYLSGSNLLTFDSIGWIDPEYNPDSTGNRGNSYPQTKFYSLGLTVSF
ncbi:MAG: TonB-dependent receptor [Bacteroidales bacterium]|jgi:TonB-linked SusC/RagA family outer membrane protein|nr:TonB-dependent receptor [Bacteroidales bacterium]